MKQLKSFILKSSTRLPINMLKVKSLVIEDMEQWKNNCNQEVKDGG